MLETWGQKLVDATNAKGSTLTDADVWRVFNQEPGIAAKDSGQVEDAKVSLLAVEEQAPKFSLDILMELGVSSPKYLIDSDVDILLEMMDDDYPPVAVSASAIVWELEKSQQSEEKMKNFCASSNLNISLMAVNYLLYSENKEPFVETIRKVHEMDDRDYNVQAASMDFLGSLGLVPNNPDYRQ